ncbi:hypothetical protein OA866_00605 [bacterium]|nr:hypothetical protein [bacterium]
MGVTELYQTPQSREFAPVLSTELLDSAIHHLVVGHRSTWSQQHLTQSIHPINPQHHQRHIGDALVLTSLLFSEAVREQLSRQREGQDLQSS